VTDRQFYLDNPVSSTNKTGCHDIAEILLKVVLNSINANPFLKGAFKNTYVLLPN
jgi:hypothetical protein